MNARAFLPAVLAGLLAPGCASGPWMPPDEAPLPAGFPEPSPPGEIVVKSYPATRGVFTRWDGALDAGTRKSFWPLFDHIRSNDIAMSAPVQADYPADVDGRTSGSMEVGFLYGDPATRPAEVDGEVAVVDRSPATFVSVGVLGKYDMSVMQPALARLRGWLAENSSRWRAAGAPRRLFYQQPIFWKGSRLYSEVQVPIEPAQNP